ncbi:hypothetical protein [Anaeromyxobacter oryzae]|uniref:DoxX family protein n=1 Tax=Anaeromyxobacter oryzae TaxID=2918170 RepID=A0ABN6N2A9_9BACT|nr:hypothetical protein [Anaeromyxobacter oryzae]BDG06044.1 hypothetical protein AMOR_50400 [Anaeromyxobacter oryzae]
MQSDRVREYALLGVTVFALSAATAVEHFVIHRQVILPVIAEGVPPAPWMWGALFVPELVVCFLAGWRLRGPAAIISYAIAAALHRAAWAWMLARTHQPGHEMAAGAFGFELVAAAVLYLAVFWVASASARTPGFVPAAGD